MVSGVLFTRYKNSFFPQTKNPAHARLNFELSTLNYLCPMHPFHETATLTINTNKISPEASGGTIEIKNILGIPIAIGTVAPHFTGNKIKLQRNNLPPGIYFYRITTKDNVSVNGKFIIN